MKLSKLFGKFFIALVVPSLMISSCALLGLEEEEETTTAATASPTVTSTDTITIGSYSYSSPLASACVDSGGGIYVKEFWSVGGTALVRTTAYSSDSSCSVSAGSTVNGYPNPSTRTWTGFQVNSTIFGSQPGGGSSSFTDADGNVHTSGLYYLVGTRDGEIEIARLAWPKSNTVVHMLGGSTCYSSYPTPATDASQCTSYSGTSDSTKLTDIFSTN